MNAPAPKLPDPTGGTPSPPPAAPSPSAPPNSPPAAAAKPSASIYEAAGVDEPGKEGSTSWPTDWRTQMAEGIEDPKQAKLLERFQKPAEIAKAWLAAQQKIRSGEYKRAAPTSDNPEELKAWREEQGIPDSPDGYELPVIPGVDLANLDEGTKATLDIVKTRLHENGFDKTKATAVAGLFQEIAAREAERTATADAGNRDAIEDTLRAEWGAEYRRNLNLNGALLTQHFGENMDGVLNARMPDGRRLADSPEFNRFLNSMARATGGDVMFDGDVKGGASIDGRLEQIRQIMNTNISEYYAKGLDKEYVQLLEKQEARGARR